jgi:hypothetical protein
MIKESLFAAEEREAKLDKLGDILQVLEKHVDFKALSQAIDQSAPRPDRTQGGRPPFPTEVMIRVVVLQQLYRVPRKTTQISHQVTVDIANQPMPAGNRLFFTRLERFFFSLKAISIRPSGALCLLTGKSRGHAAGFQAT